MISTQCIRVLLVDDHPVVRRGLAALLATWQTFEVVGEAAHGDEAVHLVAEAKPDLVLMDLSMPRLNGLDATRQLLQLCPHARVLILSMHEDEAFVGQALHAGASGFVVKQGTPEELRLAMETIAAGGMFISPAVQKPIVDEYLRLGQTEQPPTGPTLTPRERQVLQLIVEGHTNPQIGEIMDISGKTVEKHRGSLMAKLDVHDLAGLIRTALKEKLVVLDE